MEQLDKILRQMADSEAPETPELPEDYDEYIERILKDLPARRSRHISWKGAFILAAVFCVMLSCTVAAAVNYARERMEAMNEEEKESRFLEAQGPAPADFFSRELEGGEEERLERLRNAYVNEGLFPAGELKRIEDSSEYDGKGVAYMASRSVFFLPEEEMSDEELLQIIDFMEKREYSMEEAAKQIEAGNTELTDQLSAPQEPAPVPLKAGDEVIECKTEMTAYFAAASADAMYFSDIRNDFNGNRTSLFRLEYGDDTPERMEVEAPENMSFTMLATDDKGNLSVFLTETGTVGEKGKAAQLWKVTPQGDVKERYSVPGGDDGWGSFLGVMAVDGEGKCYVAKNRFSDKQHEVIILNTDGTLFQNISIKDGDIRALGRGKDGRVYGVLMEGEEYIPTVIAFDTENGTIGERYEAVLPDGQGAYTLIGAGTDSDLLIWGGQCVYSYNLGEKKAVRRLAPYELPAGGAMSILPDGRVLFITSKALAGEEDTELISSWVDKIYLMRPGK